MPFPVERMRRLRRTPGLRRLTQETRLSLDSLIEPHFVCPGSNIRREVSSMPGCAQLSVDLLVEECTRSFDMGIRSIILFGIPAHKDPVGSEGYTAHGIVPQGIAAVKKALPDMVVWADVCLCEYTDHGHCGVIDENEVDNDATLPLLAKQALAYARAGADGVAPSDMMDGRVAAIRAALDDAGFSQTPIMAYAAKFASALAAAGIDPREYLRPLPVEAACPWDVVETGLAPDTLYTDVSIKILTVPGIEAGSIVGFEWGEEREPRALGDIHGFQGRYPVGLSRYSIALPAGWSVDAYWANWTPAESRSGPGPQPSWRWELAGIPAIEEEPFMPVMRALAGRLVVRIKAANPDVRCFSDWSGIGAWYEGLSKECRVPESRVSEKARMLAEGAADTLSRLRAMAEFVQAEIRYVSIDDRGRGIQAPRRRERPREPVL